MDKTPIQQAIELLRKSRSTLIALPPHPSTDAVAASLGLYLILEKLGKEAKVVCADFDLPPHHQFLPKSNEIHTDLAALRKFVISVNVSRAPVEELSYDIAGDTLNIFLTPKSGFFEPSDVTARPAEYEYDLIVVLDCPTLESLGRIFDENAEFFYQTPIINIDHSAQNESFGQVNLLDLVATSVSEIVFELSREMPEAPLDEFISTSLLTGIISKTKSFQAPSVTPKALSIASHLISQGARREEIIQNLYRTKSISTLKLWGRALARLKTDLDDRLVWSLLTRDDFDRSGANEEALSGVIDELIVNAPAAEVTALLYEQADGTVGGMVACVRPRDSLELLRPFSPVGSPAFARIQLAGRTLAQAEQEVVDHLKNQLQQA